VSVCDGSCEGGPHSKNKKIEKVGVHDPPSSYGGDAPAYKV